MLLFLYLSHLFGLCSLGRFVLLAFGLPLGGLGLFATGCIVDPECLQPAALGPLQPVLIALLLGQERQEPDQRQDNHEAPREYPHRHQIHLDKMSFSLPSAVGLV